MSVYDRTVLRHGCHFGKPSDEDVKFIAENLRVEDREDIADLRGPAEDPETVVWVSYCMTEDCLAGYYEDHPVCLFGVAGVGDGVGCVWMLASESIASVPRHAFMAASRIAFNTIRHKFSKCLNVIPEKRERTRAWLRALGFIETVYHPTFGHSKIPFVQFEYNRV